LLVTKTFKQIERFQDLSQRLTVNNRKYALPISPKLVNYTLKHNDVDIFIE